MRTEFVNRSIDSVYVGYTITKLTLLHQCMFIKSHIAAWSGVSRDWVCFILSCRHAWKQLDPVYHSWTLSQELKHFGLLDSLKNVVKTGFY